MAEQTNSCSYPNCSFEESGHCSKHDVEVERRTNLSKLVNALADKVDQMTKKQNWVLGVLTLSGVIILGSYAYTTITTGQNREAINKHNEIITALGISSVRTEEKLSSYIIQSKDTLKAVKDLADLQYKHELKQASDFEKLRNEVNGE